MTRFHNPAAAAPAPLSVADALRAIASWTELTVQEGREARAALAKIVAQDGRPPGAIPLTPAVVRDTVLYNPAAVLGVTTGRKYNITWQIGRVMRRLGLIDAEKTAYSPAWAEARGRIDRFQRASLSPLTQACAAQQIDPADLDATRLPELLAHLETRTLMPRPRKALGSACAEWDRCCRNVPDWPGRPLATGKPARPELPPGYHADRAGFCDRLRGPLVTGDPFAPSPGALGDDAPLLTAPRALRASTIALRASHCDWAAQTLIATGFPVALIIALSVLVEPANARAILRRLYHDAGDKPSARAMHVAEVLLIIARYHVGLPPEQIAAIKQMAGVVKLSYSGMTEKNERCIRAVLTPACDEKLLALPRVLLDAARAGLAADPVEAAGLAWRALVIEILSTIPLRLDNIRKLRLDQHLHRADPRRGRITAIMITPQETKNSRVVLAPVSPPLAAMLATWITDFRPLIADPACVYLFPGRGTGNAPLTPQAMRDAVKQVTGRYVGVVVSPHQFRHLAARRFLQDNRGHYEEVRQFLNHAKVATTVRSYCGLENEAALERFDALIRDRRRGPRRTPKPTRRGKGTA